MGSRFPGWTQRGRLLREGSRLGAPLEPVPQPVVAIESGLAGRRQKTEVRLGSEAFDSRAEDEVRKRRFRDAEISKIA